jgi:hypothetical protein
MALNMIGLNSTLTKGFTQYNTTGLDAGKHIKDAIQKYISQCMNAAGGKFATMPKLNTLDLEIGKIFQKQSPSGSTVGEKVAEKIDQTFMTLMTTRQIAITTVPATLKMKCKMIFQKTPASGTSFAKDLTNAINEYASQITITAMIPGAPPVVVSGPPL